MPWADTEPADVVLDRLRENPPQQSRGESEAHFEQRKAAHADAVKREQARQVQEQRDAARKVEAKA